MKSEKISELTTNRLSVYLRFLNEQSARGEATVSSEAMATACNLNPAQIRKDLANFGEFGVRGVGYSVDSLRRDLRSILGLNKKHRVGIIGSGNLGSALANYYGFTGSNFDVAALFDVDQDKIGEKIGDVEVFDVKNFSEIAKRDNIEMAVIAVPAEAAQSVLDEVARAGINAVMSFAPVSLKVTNGMKLKTIDLTTSLESLSYFLAGGVGSDQKSVKPDREIGRN